MFNSIFKGNVQGRKHPERCAFAEPELLCFRKPKCVVMVGLKLTHWTLGYEVESSNFSKLAVFTKLWHVLSDKYQAFYTFQGSILIYLILIDKINNLIYGRAKKWEMFEEGYPVWYDWGDDGHTKVVACWEPIVVNLQVRYGRKHADSGWLVHGIQTMWQAGA